MHKTTNHVFSQFIRLQPWAFSLSLVGLLALGSCTPPAKNNLSPSQVASPDIKNAPYLLKPSAQALKSVSGLSPEIEARLRQKYGPFVKIGMDPEYWALSDPAHKNKTLYSLPALTTSDFRIQYERLSFEELRRECTGNLANDPNAPNEYNGIGSLRDLAGGSNALFCNQAWPIELNPAAEESVYACYNSGGSPVYDTKHICERVEDGGTLCFVPKFQTFYYECCSAANNYCSPPPDGNGGENPDDDACEGKCDGAGAAPFDLLMVHNNLPPNGLKPLGDAVQSQVTISPADVNDAYDSARLVINDRDNKGWKLELFKPNGKRIYEESGLGNSVAGWDGLDDNQALSNGIYRAKLTQIEDPGIVLERTVRVDNEKPVISNIRVQEEPSANRYTVKAKLKEAGNGTFQSGLNPAKTKLFFDDGVDRDDANKDYNADTGEYSVTFSDLDKYRIAKVQSQLQNGYDFPFELQIADYVGNETSNRGSGPDGPLRIQVTDPYFSPNADGVKDNLNFNVISDTSEPYQVAIKRNGIAVRIWPNLVGNQSLSWNGNFMFTDNLQADGSYRIVAMTERQRDRVRDAQMVVLDNSPPVITYEYTPRKDGKNDLKVIIEDKESGVDNSSIQVIAQNNWVLSPAVQTEKSEKRTVLKLTAEEPVFPLPTPEPGGFSTLQVAPEDPNQNTNFQIAGKITAQNKSKVAPATKEIQVNLTRIPLNGNCSIVTRVGNSADSIKAVFDLDSRNKDITLLLNLMLFLGGKEKIGTNLIQQFK